MILLKLNESSASLRVVPLPSLLSASQSTIPAINESGRTFTFSIGGVYYGSGGSLSAVSAACGMYTCNFAASKISVSGPGAVYYGGAGSSSTALPVSAPFMVVPVDSYDSMRFGLFAMPNAAADAAGGLAISDAGGLDLDAQRSDVAAILVDTGSTLDGKINTLDTNVDSILADTGTDGVVVAAASKTGYTLSTAGLAAFFTSDSGEAYSDSVAGSVVKEIADNAGGSSLTEGGIAREVWANSGRTLDGVSTATVFVDSRSIWSALRSAYTTPGSFGEYVYSQVTGTSTGTVKGVENYANISNVTLHAGTHSNVTIQGVTRLNSSVTLNANTHSGATIAGILNPISIWSAARSSYTNPGTFGEYVYSQVTGTSTGTIQGVTRALNLSANGDKTGYSISGTKTTLDALNDIDGSAVTLHAGTHSGATIKGIENYANISDVTLHAGVHSGATVAGIEDYANISNVTLHAGTHSGATVQGVSRLNSAVTLNANTHSGATIAGIVAGGIIASTLASGVITSAKFASGAIDAVALATDAGQEIADRVLLRGIEGGNDSDRSVGQALAILRNRVSVEGSTLTVFGVDDSTSMWTGSITTGAHPISGMDPLG